MVDSAASQRSLAAAVKQVLNQIGRMLEEEDPSFLLAQGAAVPAALSGWRRVVADQTRPADREREKQLEKERLDLLGKTSVMQKDLDDLRVRNSDLLDQIVKLNEKDKDLRRQLLEVQFQGGGTRAENRQLDLEIRDLRRRIRELEGGPPLSPAEAAPLTKQRPGGKSRAAVRLRNRKGAQRKSAASAHGKTRTAKRHAVTASEGKNGRRPAKKRKHSAAGRSGMTRET